jgi:hypothetical protein
MTGSLGPGPGRGGSGVRTQHAVRTGWQQLLTLTIIALSFDLDATLLRAAALLASARTT